VGAVIFFMERDREIPLRGRYFAGMVGESAVYALFVAATVSSVVGMLFMAAPPQEAIGDWWTRLALSIGAGVYEELVFRVMLVGGLFVLLRWLVPNELSAYVLAAVIGAVVFSAVHYVGTFGDVFTPASFTFRFLFGLALNGLFLWRGFGIAAWTHALYDVMLVVSGLA
jgi:hypothetical protein